MKKFFVLVLTAFAVMQTIAAPVDQVAAQRKAQAFVQSRSSQFMASSSDRFVLHRAVMSDVKVQQAAFYVFNSQNSFVIVSGDDRGEQILAYGEGQLDLDKIPANMQAWLDGYKAQISYLLSHPGIAVEANSQLKAPNRIASVAPMLTSKWDQSTPFNNQCYINGVKCMTGCPATSLAQVFYFWKYPQEPTPAVPAYSFYETNDYGYVTGTQYVEGLPSTTFDWANMKDSYTYSTPLQKTAVATLMRYIGQAEHMAYGANGSGISSDSTILITNACKFFGYDSGVHNISKTNYYGTRTYYTDAQWANLIQQELSLGRPIVYCALSSGGGHAFNIDGFDSSNSSYHINWGWSGVGDAYFKLNAFKDVDGYTYSQYQQMVIGICPPGSMGPTPVLTADPTSMTFSTSPGETVTQTFTIKGTDLNGDVTLSLSGNSNFTLSTTTISKAAATAGATVTVTYSPTAQGTHTATITASSLLAQDIKIDLTGTSVNNLPKLTVDPTSLSFETHIGAPVTQTFTVTGSFLTGNITLSVDGDDDFSLDKYAILRSAAAAGGVEVTVTYDPFYDGDHSAVVTISSAGVTPVTVALTGNASVLKYTPVMQPADASQITETSFRADWIDESPVDGIDYYTLECTAVNGASFKAATETGDANSRVVTNFYTPYYTIKDLAAGGTFRYRVKTTYIDGTESDWSNVEQVTLLQPAGPTHEYEVGDVNHDGTVNISDVTALIDYILNPSGDVCDICSDLNGDGVVNISDVTALIDKILQ